MYSKNHNEITNQVEGESFADPSTVPRISGDPLFGDPAPPLFLDDPARISSPWSPDDRVEVVVGWGTSVLEVRSVRVDRPLLLLSSLASSKPDRGSRSRPQAEVILVPEELLGEEPEVILSPTPGAPRVVFSADASGSYQEVRRGVLGRKVSLRELLDRAVSSGVPGRVELPLARGAVVALEVRGLWFSFDARQVEAAQFRQWTPDLSAVSYFAGSLLAFSGLLVSLAYFAPRQGLVDDAGIDRDRLILLQQYLSAAAVREERSPPPTTADSAEASGGEGASAAPAEPGRAGKPSAQSAPKKLSVKGPRDNERVTLSPRETVALARQWGMIGLLNAREGSAAPFSAFARDPALGADDLDARGNLWGQTIGEAAGQNGLFLSGNRAGGLYGPSTGVGIEGPLSTLGTMGHCGAGKLCSFGTSIGRSGGNRKPAAPVLRSAETRVSGRIPPGVVQRIIRQNFGRFRFCYEQGLARNPTLEGRVTIRFVIDRTGGVSTTDALGGGLPDSRVASCVAQAFYGLSFPPPDDGIVTVTYPLMLSPS